MFIVGLLIDNLHIHSILLPLIISFLFSLATIVVYGLCWRLVAKSSPKSLTMFYMAGIGLRMFLAIPFILGYWLYSDTFEDTLRFVIVFIIFYFAVLAFDAIYFASVERQQTIEQ